MNGFNDTVDGFSLSAIQELQAEANSIYLDTGASDQPSSTVTLDDSVFYVGKETTTINITFDSEPTNFKLADIVAPNMVVSNLQGSGLDWTATLTKNSTTTSRDNVVTVGNTSESYIYTILDFTQTPLPSSPIDITDQAVMDGYGLTAVACDGSDDYTLLNAINNNASVTNWYIPSGKTMTSSAVSVKPHVEAIFGGGTIVSYTTNTDPEVYKIGAINLNSSGNNLHDNFILDGLNFNDSLGFIGKNDYGQVQLNRSGGATIGCQFRNCTFTGYGTALNLIATFGSFDTDDFHEDFFMFNNTFEGDYRFVMEIINHSESSVGGYKNMNVFDNIVTATDTPVDLIKGLSFSGVGRFGVNESFYCFNNNIDGVTMGIEMNGCKNGYIYRNLITNCPRDILQIGNGNETVDGTGGEIAYNHFYGTYTSNVEGGYGRIYKYSNTQPHFHHNYLSGIAEINNQQTGGDLGQWHDNVIVAYLGGADGYRQDYGIFVYTPDTDAFTSGDIYNNDVYVQADKTGAVGITLQDVTTGVNLTANNVYMRNASASCISADKGTQVDNVCTKPYTGEVPTE